MRKTITEVRRRRWQSFIWAHLFLGRNISGTFFTDGGNCKKKQSLYLLRLPQRSSVFSKRSSSVKCPSPHSKDCSLSTPWHNTVLHSEGCTQNLFTSFWKSLVQEEIYTCTKLSISTELLCSDLHSCSCWFFQSKCLSTGSRFLPFLKLLTLSPLVVLPQVKSSCPWQMHIFFAKWDILVWF